MAHEPKPEELNLIKKIQRGYASVDVETGDVTSGVTHGLDYLGTLRRKLIPDRRRLEKESVEEKKEDEILDMNREAYNDNTFEFVDLSEGQLSILESKLTGILDTGFTNLRKLLTTFDYKDLAKDYIVAKKYIDERIPPPEKASIGGIQGEAGVNFLRSMIEDIRELKLFCKLPDDWLLYNVKPKSSHFKCGPCGS